MPKTSRYLASFLCFVGCFILSTLLQIRIKTFNLLLSPNLSAILLICASATFLLINLVSTFSTQFQPFLHSISAFCIIWSLYGINWSVPSHWHADMFACILPVLLWKRITSLKGLLWRVCCCYYYINVHEKLRAPDWLKTTAFSCNTSAKL